MMQKAFPLSAMMSTALCGIASEAQAATALVSGCSGVSLPPSVVTEIMRPVVQGVVAPVENSVNALTDALSGVPLIGTLPGTLDTNATGLLNSAAAGQPVTLSALTTSGTVVGPADDCVTTSDAVTLDSEAGIAIGGNRITGLGQNGLAATAGGLNAVAIGNNASAAAAGSVALGLNASASAGNSVALGAGSTTTANLAAGAFQPGGAGVAGATATGEVSVGAVNGERRVTNVAAGAAGTDAANVSQLQAVDTRLTGEVTTINNTVATVDGRVTVLEGREATVTNQITALGDRVTNIDGRITTVTTSVAEIERLGIRYDNSDKNSATLGGEEGTVIANLRGGTISRSSREAVNGSQLAATNEALSALSEAAVTYDVDAAGRRTGAVTLGGNNGGPVRVRNVARGEKGADAANMDQLREESEASRKYSKETAQAAYDLSRDYTDRQLGNVSAGLDRVNARVDDVEDQARRAAAIGLAAASLRFDDRPGKFSMGVAGGTWRGESAFAAGVGYTAEGGRVKLNATASVADGDIGGGAGLSFTFN